MAESKPVKDGSGTTVVISFGDGRDHTLYQEEVNGRYEFVHKIGDEVVDSVKTGSLDSFTRFRREIVEKVLLMDITGLFIRELRK
jgi:hypothetical protein